MRFNIKDHLKGRMKWKTSTEDNNVFKYCGLCDFVPQSKYLSLSDSQ